MLRIFSISLVMSFLLAQPALQAQSVIDKGYIKIEVVDVKTEDSQMAAMAGMFKNSFTEVYFLPQKSLTKLSMMGGMTTTTILTDEKSENNLYLMSLMGQKIKLDLTKEELAKMQAGENKASDVKIKYFKDQKRTILGYSCHKAEMVVNNTQEVAMTLWVTEQIKSNAQVAQGMEANMLKGFPLAYELSVQGQFTMLMEATKIEKDFDKTVFNVNTKGYKSMTFDEFMESMGSMMGGMK